jgi:hypothetical protein
MTEATTATTLTEADYVARRQAVYDWLTANPGRHCQDTYVTRPGIDDPGAGDDYPAFEDWAEAQRGYWSKAMIEGTCGTTLCVAGRACLQYAPEDAEFRNGEMRTADGVVLDMGEAAAGYLGFSLDWGGAIFTCFFEARALRRLKATIDNPVITAYELYDIL